MILNILFAFFFITLVVSDDFNVRVQMDPKDPLTPIVALTVSDYVKFNTNNCCYAYCKQSAGFTLPPIPGAYNYLSFSSCPESNYIAAGCPTGDDLSLESLITIVDNVWRTAGNTSMGNISIITNRAPYWTTDDYGFPICQYKWERTIRQCGTIGAYWNDNPEIIDILSNPYSQVIYPPTSCNVKWSYQFEPSYYQS